MKVKQQIRNLVKTFIVTAVFILAGCSSMAKSPLTANTAEILFGDNVQRYLQQRRAELSELNSHLDDLDDQLLERLGELHKLEKTLSGSKSKLAISDNELVKVKQQLEKQKRKAEQVYARTNELKEQAEQLQEQEQQAKADLAKDKAEIKKVSADIERLQGEVVVMNRSIERTLNLKAEQYLRN